MTVQELIRKLGEYDDDLVVAVDGYEAGLSDLEESNLVIQHVMLSAYGTYEKKKMWWMGVSEPLAEETVLRLVIHWP